MKGEAPAVTIDASVWIASLIASEPAHRECAAVVHRVFSDEVTLVQPTLFLVEGAASFGRRFRGGTHAETAIDRLLRLSTMREVLERAPADARVVTPTYWLAGASRPHNPGVHAERAAPFASDSATESGSSAFASRRPRRSRGQYARYPSMPGAERRGARRLGRSR